jgi:hypothetical protein
MVNKRIENLDLSCNPLCHENEQGVNTYIFSFYSFNHNSVKNVDFGIEKCPFTE